jgi:hypothetical protein
MPRIVDFSSLASRPIRIRSICHAAALYVIAAAIAAGMPELLRVGAAVGLVGAFLWFTADVLRHLVPQS